MHPHAQQPTVVCKQLMPPHATRHVQPPRAAAHASRRLSSHKPPCPCRRSYFDWAIQAAKLDALEGVDQAQRWAAETRLYDRRLLR